MIRPVGLTDPDGSPPEGPWLRLRVFSFTAISVSLGVVSSDIAISLRDLSASPLTTWLTRRLAVVIPVRGPPFLA